MVKVIYREHGQQADLAGKSVAEVRELYKSELSIPDQARASLNGKQLKRKLEPETKLGDQDKLSFEERSGRGLVLFGAFLLTLAITGGLFAYTFVTQSATLEVTTAGGDFASITANSTGIDAVENYQPFGRYRGTIPSGNLFDVTPTANYTGDLEVTVYLANPDELSKNYRFWLLRLELQDSGTTEVDAQGETQVLTLDNSEVTFYWPSDNYTDGTEYYITCEGGAYVGLPWVGTGWSGGTYNPLLFAQVTQAGLETPNP